MNLLKKKEFQHILDSDETTKTARIFLRRPWRVMVLMGPALSRKPVLFFTRGSCLPSSFFFWVGWLVYWALGILGTLWVDFWNMLQEPSGYQKFADCLKGPEPKGKNYENLLKEEFFFRLYSCTLIGSAMNSPLSPKKKRSENKLRWWSKIQRKLRK